MSAERTCLFCGGEITPENILFSYKAYAGVSYEDELRTSFLSSCSNGLEARVGENQGGTTRYKALYYETSHAYDMETDASGLPINMLKVPVNAGLTPRQLERKRNGEVDLETGEPLVTDRTPRNLTTRVCPHCHCELPANFGLYPIISVAMIGGKSSGKTAFLLTLTQRLESDLSRRNLGTASLVGESQTYFDMLEESFLELEGRTTGTPTESRLFPFVFEYTSLSNPADSCYVVIYDMAGESMKNADALGEQMGLRRSNTVLMMLDCNQLTEGMYYDEERQRNALLLDAADEDMDDAVARADNINSYNSPIDTFLATRISRYRGAHIFDHVQNVIAVTTKIDQVLCYSADKHLFLNDSMALKQNIETVRVGPAGQTQAVYTHTDALESEVLAKVEGEMNGFYQTKNIVDLRGKVMSAFKQTGRQGVEQKVNVYLLAVSTFTRHPELEKEGKGTCAFKNDYTRAGKKHRIIEPFLLILAGNGRIPVKGRFASRYSPRAVDETDAPQTLSLQDSPRPVVNDAKGAKPEKEQKKRRGLFGRR